MAAKLEDMPRVRIKIDPRSFRVVTDTSPTQFRLRGSVGLHKELICQFWGFKASRYDKEDGFVYFSPWFISLVVPQDAPKDWPKQEFHAEIVAAVREQVETFWQAVKPRPKPAKGKPVCPKPSQCRRFVTLSAAAASALIILKGIKNKKTKPDSPTT